MPKKMLVVTDGILNIDSGNEEQILAMLKEMESYGVEATCVCDDGLFSEGNSPKEAILRVETEGPNWVKHSPDFLKEVEDAEIILVHFSGVGEQLLNHAKKLKYIGVMRSGVENVDLALCQDKNIAVCNSPGRVSEPVADFTVALMLDINRYLSHNNLVQRPGFDAQLPSQPKLMKNSTVGLVGFGIIAKKVAQRIKGFGATVLAYDPFANAEEAKELGVSLVPLDQVMSQSDFVSVHARLLPSTKNLVGEKEISLMKPDAILINTARAGLVDEDALIKALKEKKIRGAALDVFRQEPLPDDHILRKLDNVLLTPHLAGAAGDTLQMSLDIALAEVKRYLTGNSLLYRIK